MDKLFTQTKCDRCGGSLEKGRTMSMFNTECICMECKAKERERADYQEATTAVRDAESKGDRNFPGIGYKK